MHVGRPTITSVHWSTSGHHFRKMSPRQSRALSWVLDSITQIPWVSKSNISRLQRVQNSLSRVVTRSRRSDRITPILKRLHWLPISYRIQFKIATLTFKMRETGHPEHFKPIVADRLPTRALRSSYKHFLNQPPVKIEIAKRAFSQAAPSVWNSLPLNCRTANTSIFKKLLKTHIFKLAYPDWSCDNFPRPRFIACIAIAIAFIWHMAW